MKITMTPINERQRARFIYKKQQKKLKTFLYSKSKTLFKNKKISVTVWMISTARFEHNT